MKITPITTPRLIIRKYTPEDAVLLKKAIDDSLEHLRKRLPRANDEPESLENKKARIHKFTNYRDKGEERFYGIFLPDNSLQVGAIGLHGIEGKNEIAFGYWIRKSHVGRGYMTEVVRHMLPVAFDGFGFDAVEIYMDPKNTASANVPEKCGFISNKEIFKNEDGRDTIRWRMTKEAFDIEN